MFDLKPYELYVFCVCMVVYVLLSGLFIFLFGYLLKLMVRHIRAGLEDEKIWKEYFKHLKKNKEYGKKKVGMLDIFFTAVFCCIIFGTFAFSIYSGFVGENVLQDRSIFRSVLSSSMSKKNEENEYLFENNLDNQFDRFDLILTTSLPKEEDLKLYDIVVYEVEDMMVVHRIVDIEEPNAKHPDERWFMLQGDAVERPDRYPVRYEQMRALYAGKKIPFIGSWVNFMQSPAGYMCILLVIFGVICIPWMDNKLMKERLKRLQFLLMQKKKAEERARAEANGESCVTPYIVRQVVTTPSYIPVPMPYYQQPQKQPCRCCGGLPCRCARVRAMYNANRQGANSQNS